MSALYNEYLTGAEREAAVIVAESEARFAKLNVLLETVDATLEANMLAAEAKVFAENGTYDDLTMLYKEAGAEADVKKQGIFAAIFGAIKNFFKKIGEFFKKHFGNGEIPAQAEVPSDLENNMNIFEKAWATLKSGIAKLKAGQIKEGCKELLKVVFPTALTAGVATATTVVVVKREKIKAWIDGLKAKQQEVEDATAAAETAINNGSAILDTVSNVASTAAGETDTDQKPNDKEKTVGQKAAGVVKKVADFTKETAQKALALLKKFGQWIISAIGKIKNWITKKTKQDDDLEEVVVEEDDVELAEEVPAVDEEEVPAEEEAPADTSSKKSKKKANKGKVTGESVSLFGVELESDEVFIESMTEEEYTELCDLFDEL